MRPICNNGIINRLRCYQQQSNLDVRAVMVQNLITKCTQRIPHADGPRKVLKVRDRNVDFSFGKIGTLKPVMGKRFYKHHYTHVQLRGKIHCVHVSDAIFDGKIVWIH